MDFLEQKPDSEPFLPKKVAEIAPKRFLICPHCQAKLGVYISDKRVQIGNLQFTELIRPTCIYCSHRVRWYPVDAEKKLG